MNEDLLLSIIFTKTKFSSLKQIKENAENTGGEVIMKHMFRLMKMRNIREHYVDGHELLRMTLPELMGKTSVWRCALYEDVDLSKNYTGALPVYVYAAFVIDSTCMCQR